MFESASNFLAGNQELIDSERRYREKQEKQYQGKRLETQYQLGTGPEIVLGSAAVSRSVIHPTELDGSYVLHGSD